MEPTKTGSVVEYFLLHLPTFRLKNARIFHPWIIHYMLISPVQHHFWCLNHHWTMSPPLGMETISPLSTGSRCSCARCRDRRLATQLVSFFRYLQSSPINQIQSCPCVSSNISNHLQSSFQSSFHIQTLESPGVPLAHLQRPYHLRRLSPSHQLSASASSDLHAGSRCFGPIILGD